MIFKKINKLTNKMFSSKTYLLIGLNKFIPDELGQIVDMTVDRGDKNIFLELEKEKNKARLNILKYGIVYEGTQAYLSFDKIEKDGYLKSALKSVQSDKKIKIDSKYVKVVQRMI